jgi:L-ascorbate metabolism protein UlaG (beta-lactamase superfamily)
MKITKYAQSCILIEAMGKRILVDPGTIDYNKSYPESEWSKIDVILVIHKHEDHCNVDAIKEIMKNSKTKFYSSREVSDFFSELSSEIVKVGDLLTLEDIKIEVVKAVHGYIPLFRGDKEIHENIGFIVDDGVSRAYQTRDSISFKNDYKCDVLFIPVVDHGIVMGPWDAALFAKETDAKIVIPIHYDNPSHPADFKSIKKEFEALELNYKFLEIGESIVI